MCTIGQSELREILAVLPLVVEMPFAKNQPRAFSVRSAF
jgi:hypothetical protein